jgi:hypothetical protein
VKVVCNDLRDGRYGVVASAENVLGVRGDPAQTVFIVDATPPQGAIALQAAGVFTSSSSVTVLVSVFDALSSDTMNVGALCKVRPSHLAAQQGRLSLVAST